MTLRRHLIAAIVLAAITCNLLLWCVPLLVLLLVRLAVPGSRRQLARLTARIYRAAVAIDDCWLRNISGADWRRPELELDPERPCIIIANHRSWADTFVLQSVVSRHGPILKFLCKRELAWIPVLGLIFIAFDFPMLRRRSGTVAEPGRTRGQERPRRDDIDRVREACAVLREAPAAMLAFVEGTRYTEAKRDRLASPHRHLLPIRAGGFGAMLDSLGASAAAVVDVTLFYPNAPSFWRFLAGAAGTVDVHADRFTAREVRDAGSRPWLETRWRAKDAALARAAAGEANT